MGLRSRYLPIGLNLLVLPGLGTWMTGRRVSGALQITMAVSGFVLAVSWFVQLIRLYARTNDFPSFEMLPWRALAVGVILFAGAWLWSLGSSLVMLARQHEPQPPTRPTP